MVERPRLLLAVEPRMFEGALARLLRIDLAGHVLALREATARDLAARFDAAVVTDDLPDAFAGRVRGHAPG